jgi:hypothetical protein
VFSTRQHVQFLHTQTIREISVEAARTIAWKKVVATLKRLHRSIFSVCGDRKAFENLLVTNEEVKQAFGEFRGAFYRGTVGNVIKLVFIIDQLLEELQDGFDMYACVLSITPLDHKNFLS